MTRQDIDLQKIQVLESSYQGWFNFKASIVAGTIVGTVILIVNMQYQNIINLYGVFVGYLFLVIGAFYFISDMKESHDEHISFMNGLILRIEEGEKLESIEELRKMHKKSAKTKNIKPKSSNAKT